MSERIPHSEILFFAKLTKGRYKVSSYVQTRCLTKKSSKGLLKVLR